MINAERIEEMKRLSAEATEGAWVAEFESVKAPEITIDFSDKVVGYGMDEADAKFIADSRQFVPDIIAAYEQQAAEIERLDELYSQKYILATHYKNATYEYSQENGRLRQENEDLKRSLLYIAERREGNRDWAQAHNALAVWGRPKGAY